jgi:hypothetical protein
MLKRAWRICALQLLTFAFPFLGAAVAQPAQSSAHAPSAQHPQDLFMELATR